MFKEFKMPLQLDDMGMYVFDAEGKMCLQFITNISEEIKQAIVDKINGNPTTVNTPEITYKETEYFAFDECIMLQRGWGYLTGTGSLNLKPEEAVKIQDDFAQFVIDKINTNV